MYPAVVRQFRFAFPLMLLAAPAFADAPAKIQYVGSVSINPCQEAKVLAEWYSRLGIETKEMQGGYYAMLDTASGPFFFGIHPHKASAPQKCTGGVSVVYRVDTIEGSLSAAKTKGLAPDSTQKDEQGQFAHFHDPDGNEVTLWGK